MKANRRISIPSREPITINRLIAIAWAALDGAGEYVEWKERIHEQAIAKGFRITSPPMFHEAMRRCEAMARRKNDPRGAWLWQPSAVYDHPIARERRAHHDPTIVPKTDPRHPAGMHPAAAVLRATTTGNVCGNSKHVSGITALVCNLEAGHTGDHAMATAKGGIVFVRWAREA